jgi:hypothetical protein
MKRIWTIAIVDAAELRDYKLKKLTSEDATEIGWNYLVKVYDITNARYARVNPVFAHSYECRYTKKPCRHKLSSASIWKTEKGALNTLNTITSNEKIFDSLKKKFSAPVTLHLVEISEIWKNSVESLIEYEKQTHAKTLEKLYNKLK